jgi:hypothetical protein
MLIRTFSAAAALSLAATAPAQVVINEVFENPAGGSADNLYEYIELYGAPGMDLTGYAIALFKGGMDDGDDMPEEPAEIDEAFSLDGLSIGPNGFLVIYNRDIGFSEVGTFLEGPFGPGANSAGWDDSDLGIPSSDDPGKLSNDGSSTYLLVRKRPYHEVIGGQSFYDGSPGFFVQTRYAFRKDVDPDQNYDSDLDFEEQGFSAIEPLQIVDEIAWSNAGGKEYVRSSEHEISDTPGFNPDGVVRVAYYAENPMLGHRINNDGEVVPTRIADESWVYGENVSQTAVLDGGDTIDLLLPFNAMFLKGPTDPNGPTYNANGELDPMGSFLFDDLAITDFEMTPGEFNDSPAGASGATITQFRFVWGDLNFDGISDVDDFVVARDLHLSGATLDDTETRVNDNGTPDFEDDDFTYEAYVFENRAFNGYLAATNLDTMDNGMGGNAETVTSFDVTALRVALGAGVAPDQNGDGRVDASDLASLISGWGGNNPFLDLNADGVVNASDLAALIAGWGDID